MSGFFFFVFFFFFSQICQISEENIKSKSPDFYDKFQILVFFFPTFIDFSM